ncbi:MAG: hypothetical protein IKI54_05625 [Lachnospiraceae bacterium]|nr:hypothetical protein [Lachnospiraceae bacterium]
MSLFDNLLKKLGNEAKNSLNNLSNTAAHKVKSELNSGVNDAINKVKFEASLKRKKVKLDRLPQDVEDMKSLPNYDQKNEYVVAALTVAALLRYGENKEDGKAMLDLLNGPDSPANRDLMLMDLKLGERPYLMRSYFAGATPENNYTPTQPYTVELIEYSNSREEENYVYLSILCGGADSPRQIRLRKKPSTGEWFIWIFQGLLSDIRIPKSEDEWA